MIYVQRSLFFHYSNYFIKMDFNYKKNGGALINTSNILFFFVSTLFLKYYKIEVYFSPFFLSIYF